MSTSLVQKLMARRTHGFVTAFHDIPPEDMERLIDAFEGMKAVHLGELVDRAKAGKATRGLFAITVDDGVHRSVTGIAALCVRRSWPVTFFLPTENLDTGVGSAYEWWRQIQPLLPGRKLKLSSKVVAFERKTDVTEMATEMERLWHSSPAAEYQPFTMELVEALQRDLGVATDFLRPQDTIPWSKVEELSKNELLHFESHGISHVALSAMREDELDRELRASRDTVSQHTGKPCRHFAYPFGSVQSIGARAPVIARRYYDSAATMCMGSVDAANPWLLPRIPLYPKNSRLAAQAKVLLHCMNGR